MKHTLVAAFDDLSTAQAAKTQLLQLNIADSSIELSTADATAQGTMPASETSAATTAGPHTDDGSFGDKVSHFFSSLFGSDDDGQPHRYSTAYPEAYRRGATLITVTVADDLQAEQVEDILQAQGAIDIDERAATWTDGAPGVTAQAGLSHVAGTHLDAGSTAPANATGMAPDLSGNTAIPVIEEQLRVGKREVNTGRVRVVTRVTERPVEETVSLREEHANIERRPVDRVATAGELNAFKDGAIEIQETAEEVVVDKSARVVEEVSVGKTATERKETVRDTLRRTDVEVENRQGELTKAAASSERNKPLDR